MAETNEKDWREKDIDGLKQAFETTRRISLFTSIGISIPIILSLLGTRLGFWFWFIFLSPLIIFYLTYSVKFIKAWEEGVVFTLGRMSKRPRKPGLALVWRPFQKIIFIKMYERERDPAPEEILTLDNIMATVDIKYYWKVSDPCQFVIGAENAVNMAEGLIMAGLRQAIPARTFDDARKDKDQISKDIIKVLVEEGYSTPKEVQTGTTEEGGDRWGIQVTTVKIIEVRPPKELEEAMTRYAAAEKNKETTRVNAEAEAIKMTKEGEGEGERRKRVADGEEYALQKILGAKAGMFKKLIEADPELTTFLLDTLGKFGEGKGWIVGADLRSALGEFLRKKT